MVSGSDGFSFALWVVSRNRQHALSVFLFAMMPLSRAILLTRALAFYPSESSVSHDAHCLEVDCENEDARRPSLAIRLHSTLLVFSAFGLAEFSPFAFWGAA